MKKFLYSTFVCLMVALVGCESADITINAIDAPTKKVTITADIQGSDATRVVLTPESTDGKNTVKVEWKESDETFEVYGYNGDGYLVNLATFTQTTGNEFEAEVKGEWHPSLACYGNHELVNGIITYDLSEQDGTLNEDYVIMAAGLSDLDDHLNFEHKTAILKPTFTLDGMDVDAKITNIVVHDTYAHSTNTEINTITVTPKAADDIYIFLLRDRGSYPAGYSFTFDVAIGEFSYNATLTIPANMSIVAGKYYTATIDITDDMCMLPDGETINTALRAAVGTMTNPTIVFETESTRTGGTLLENSYAAYIKSYPGETNTIYIYTPKNGMIFHSDCSLMFWGLPANRINFTDDNLDTHLINNMSDMFYGCTSLQDFDWGGFAVQNVTNMARMFYGCTALTSLDLSSFSTANVTTMENMFQNCSALTTLTLGNNFNTGNVESMLYMFGDCSALGTVDLSGFNTSKVTTMSRMFDGCIALTSLNFSSFNTSSVTDMSFMFKNCQALTKLNLNGFETSKVTTMASMLEGCVNMEHLNVFNFNLSNINRDANGNLIGIKDMLKNLSRDYDDGSGIIYATETLHGQLGTVIVEGETQTIISGLNYKYAYFSYKNEDF